MGAKFRYDDGEIRRGIRELDRRLELAVELIIEKHAVQGEAAMRTEAPWTDRTGAARSGLHTLTYHESDRHTIIFAHSVHYGIWLEVKDSGQYEVIMPVVRDTGKELMSDLDHLFRRLR